jgi:hypothetical protein
MRANCNYSATANTSPPLFLSLSFRLNTTVELGCVPRRMSHNFLQRKTLKKICYSVQNPVSLRVMPKHIQIKFIFDVALYVCETRSLILIGNNRMNAYSYEHNAEEAVWT